MIILLLKDFLFCFGATAFFTLLFHSPKRTILVTSLIASTGYLVYDIIVQYGGNELSAYFFGSLLVAGLCEIAARALKAPATIFLFPGIIPFVPGLGIYKTMRYMADGDFDNFLRTGVYTLMIAGAIAAAAALMGILYRSKTYKQKTEGTTKKCQ